MTILLKQIFCRNLILVSLFCVFFSACSKSLSLPSDQQVGEAVKLLLPANHQVIRVAPLKAVPGLIEVVAKIDNTRIVLYLDNSLKYVFSGSLMEIATKKNLTAEAQNIQ